VPAILGYTLLVGTRKAPGLLLFLHPRLSHMLRRRIPGLAAARLSALKTVRQALRANARDRSVGGPPTHT
jgi:hypothetical protein